MNICLGIFVLVALASSIECNFQTRGQHAFLSMLGSKQYGDSKSYNYEDKFYSSLLALDISVARKAIEERDHQGTFDCPYINNYECDPYFPWRTIDGSCNNLQFPWWGATGTMYKRLLKPDFEPQGRPRAFGKCSGKPLENPRTIALKVHYPHDIYIDISNYVPVMSQFVFHDVSHFAPTLGEDGELLKCRCGSNNPNCVNIPVPRNDYYNKDKKCLIQVRDRPSFPEFNCYTQYRENLNDHNSFVDLSTVYGNTEAETKNLRSGYNGRLRTSSFKGLGGEYLPTGCPASGYSLSNNFCFVAGDSRVNQYPLLTSMHTIWVREHNRIAEILWKINPKWDDEFLFQLARHINIGQYQNIVYNELLPIVVGSQISAIFDLTSDSYQDYFMEYDPLVFPNSANEFSVSAARFGHALTIPYESQYNQKDYVVKNNSLNHLMFNPKLLMYPDSMEGFLRGCQRDQANWFSPHLTDYLSNYIKHDMGPHNPSNGHSLPAWNVNRGREHGVRSYNDYRPFAGLKKAKRWEDLTFIPKGAIERLKSVYECPDDIDLWTGMMSEYPLPDGVVGPTAAYVLARGFRDWKYGDRWWFENGHDDNTKLTIPQIRELRKSSLARIICDNSNINKIPANVFLLEGKNNPTVDCDSLPAVNLNPFKNFGRKKKQYY